MHSPHCPQFNLSVLANFFKNSTITTIRTMVMAMIPQNNLFLRIPLNTFFFSSFLALNSLNTWQRTKVLKINVSFTFSVTPKIDSPLNCKVRRTIIWYKAWAKRFLHIMLVISGSVRPIGGFVINSLMGFSVARARAPNVSIIRFTHNNWTAVNGTSPAKTAATKLIIRAATFTVSWNWMNFWILLYTHLPHL